MNKNTLMNSPFQLLAPLFEREDEWLIPKLSFTQDQGLTVAEDANHVTVEASLPGLDSENIEVTYQKGILWIKGSKAEEKGDKEKKYYHKASSSFSYSVRIPGRINETKEPQATFKNGVMKVVFTKAESETPRRITVNAG